MPNYVQLYKSTDVGAPTLTGQTNSLIALFNKVLVDGYSTVSVTSITRSGATATVTIAANTTLVTGNYVTILGAVETEYNGTFQITVTNSTTFTYTVTGTPATPASGTITYNKASLQWTRPYTGTNAAVYRSADVTSNQFYCQVIDNGATAGGSKEGQIMGFEAMTAYNTGTRQFPNTTQAANGLSIRKSTTADATTRAWSLIGDDRTFYFIANTGDSTAFHSCAFGHFISAKTGDVYNTFINGEVSFNTASSVNNLMLNTTNWALLYNSTFAARPFHQLPAAPANLSMISIPFYNADQVIGSTAHMAVPNGPDTGYYVIPATMYENVNGGIRGRFPGMFVPLQVNPVANYETMTNIAGLPGVTLTGLSVCAPSVSGVTGLVFFDTFGPWT